MKSIHNVQMAESRPDADGTLDSLFELSLLMSDYMERALAERGLTRARATVVWELFHRGPVTQRELSQALKVTPRNVTALLDALQEGGFVDRNAHPTDRRATLVTITKKGRAAAKAMSTDHRDFAARLFSSTSAADLTQFHTTLTAVLNQLREQAHGDIP